MKRIIAFTLFIPLIFMVATCSDYSSNQVSDELPVEQTQDITYQSTREEGESIADSEDISDSDEIEEADSSKEPECQIRLTLSSSNNASRRQVDCAKAFNIDGTIEINQGEREEDSNNRIWKNIKELDGPSNEKLLNAEENAIRVQKGSRGSARFLFNTLDLIAVGENTQFLFEVGGSVKGNANLEPILLDFGKLMVSNAIPESPSLRTDISDQSVLPSISSIDSNRSKLKQLLGSFFRNLDKIHFVASLQSKFPGSLVAQPAFAFDENEIQFTSPTFQVETPEAVVSSGGAVYMIERRPFRKETQVYSISMRPVEVIDNFGGKVELRRNETVLVTRNGIRKTKFEFPLCGTFYRRNSELLRGLPPQEEVFVSQQPYPLQMGYHAARSMTLPLYHRNCQRICPPRGSGI